MRTTCRAFRKRSPALVPLVAMVATIGMIGCNYTFAGGGGLPSHIETVYVPPVDNNTTQFALTQTFTDKLLEAVRRNLGVQLAAEAEADATIVAELSRYTDLAINFQGVEDVGAAVFQRRVSIVARVQIIDRSKNEIIWNGTGVSGEGEYSPADPAGESTGQEVALDNLVQKIVDGAQSQW
ncbi:LPS assembly lipoprotein LptE [Gemmatimonadota bacterium]